MSDDFSVDEFEADLKARGMLGSEPSHAPTQSIGVGQGIGLRDLFAGLAMQAWITRNGGWPHDTALKSYEQAEAMLKARTAVKP